MRIFARMLAVVVWLGLAGPTSAGIILYTASTDNSGFGGDPSVPASNNPYLPSISTGVTIAPNPAFLGGTRVGPLGGIVYGPSAFGANNGGTTGFVHVSYTLATSGTFQIVWEVSDVIDHSRPSALAIDNVQLGGSLLYGFESGVPSGFTSLGTVSTSAAVTGLAPTQGTQFAYMDTTGNAPATYDTVDGTFGSRMISARFTGTAGQTLSLDMAFLTNDGGPFHDYAIAELRMVPEPGSLTLVATGLIGLAGLASYRRKQARGDQGST